MALDELSPVCSRIPALELPETDRERILNACLGGIRRVNGRDVTKSPLRDGDLLGIGKQRPAFRAAHGEPHLDHRRWKRHRLRDHSHQGQRLDR